MRKLYMSAGAIVGFILLLPFMTNADEQPTSAKINVLVSILPQAYFVERIGNDRVSVSALVQPGVNPHAYEVTLKQMIDLSKSRIYFRIGDPFEEAIIKKIAGINKNIRIVDCRKGIKLLPMVEHHHEERENEEERQHGMMDPHTWLSPPLVKIQADTICEALIEIDAGNKDFYIKNKEEFKKDLDELDGYIREKLKNLRVRKFIVFHPAWAYFAKEYNLEEIPIELAGKEPGAPELVRIINEAKKNNIKVIFAEPQFSTKSAEVIAREIGGKVIKIDDLARDYIKNLKSVADTLAEVGQ